ncbi:MAG: GMC family oxidoreductase [Saprospiraceae bacterium]|nr:GMC family oxidoreductase [Saprospiraceae bacterium]
MLFQDTINLNTKAKGQNTYDAIVIGSGISGGWAAKELCERGLKVLMLERGGPLQHPNYETAALDPWDFPHRNRLSKVEKEKYHIQSRHYSIGEDNKRFYTVDTENPYEETQRYDWIRANIVGGRSLLWGRLSWRWSDFDFESNLMDGHGVDWPVRYKDIAPWYDYVERFIGVSGNKDGIGMIPDGVFQKPMEMNCVEKDFAGKMKQQLKRPVIISRVANLTEPVKGRGVCQNRNLCHRGCPYGAYFSTNASTLPAAFESGNLTLRPFSLVNQIFFDEQSQTATGVEVIDTETKATEEFHAKLIFVNASTLATAQLLLSSTSSRFPNGLGNDSDQVGRNIMDHHKHAGASALIEGFEDKYYYGRRPTGIYVPRFRNVKGTRNERTDYIRGFGLQGEASRGGWRKGNIPDEMIGETLKDALTEPGPWRLQLNGYGECLPYSENRITLDKDQKDAWGRPILIFDVSFKENEKAMQKDMAQSAAEMLELAGYKDVKSFDNISFPGNANHEMGSARMGKDPKTSVLNSFNQMHAVKNIFITDGSFMTSSSCLNPSLTYMAFTARACDYAVKEMKKGNI